MKESAQQPEGQQESKGILGTIRDYLTPEFAETAKSELPWSSNLRDIVKKLTFFNSVVTADEGTKSSSEQAKGMFSNCIS